MLDPDRRDLLKFLFAAPVAVTLFPFQEEILARELPPAKKSRFVMASTPARVPNPWFKGFPARWTRSLADASAQNNVIPLDPFPVLEGASWCDFALLVPMTMELMRVKHYDPYGLVLVERGAFGSVAQPIHKGDWLRAMTATDVMLHR